MSIKSAITSSADPARAAISSRFFKTGKDEYGEGDQFLGLTVPECRKIAKQFCDISLAEARKLLHSKIHEERLIALIILVDQFARGNKAKQKQLYWFYLCSTKWINNWDLVDLSADKIVGRYLLDKPIDILEKLARSKDLWERRIAMIATLAFIRANRFAETFKISELLLRDPHDLIHKAVGWMLREVGNRDQAVAEKFLRVHYREMPRTMLRYAIEKFPETRRKKYLKNKVIVRSSAGCS